MTSDKTEGENSPETTPTPKTSEIGLKTRHVLIDTSVYRKFGFNLRSKLFKEFTSIALSHQIKIHIDPILSKEIDRGMGEIAAKLIAQHRQYARLQNHWNSRFPKPEVIAPLEIDGMVAAARREFDFIMKIVGRTSHGLGDQTVAEALNHYFERKAPFEREGSREFPDYFILRAAEQQAATVGGIYVISLDGAMLQAAASFKGLYPINGLEAFLQIIASLEDPEIQNVVERFVGDEDAVFRVGEVLADALREEDLRYDGSRFEDFQVTGFDLESIDDPVDFVVISANEDTVVLSGELYGEGHAEGEAEVSYDQGPDEPTFDTVERFDFHARTMARVILTFNRRTFEDVELEITQPFVYVREYGKGY